LVNTDDSFSTGVPVGVLEPLPRTQQVFPPKLKHKKLGDSEFNPVAVNYPSARVSVADLEKKFLEEEVLGRMFPLRLSVAKEKFGEDKVRVASMAATTKPDGSVRPLHDGTHSVQVNNAIVYKDQIQCPGPPEVLESREAPYTALRLGVSCLQGGLRFTDCLDQQVWRLWHFECALLVGKALFTGWTVCGPLDVNNLVSTHGLCG
jgi:hypothetical protein